MRQRGSSMRKILMLVLAMLWAGVMPLQAQAMSLNVQDADAREILNSVAQMAQVNIIVDESVTGKVSIKVEDMEPE